ncbi:MAG: Gfo/Idh/MocA family protein [Planctomycetota bacterium]|jgi:predicted dehydrogenase
MKRTLSREPKRLSRRDVIKTSGVIGTAALLTGTGRLWAGGSDKIRIGVIGCGGRGTYDTRNCLNAAPNVELVAMGDLFEDRLNRCRRQLSEELGDKVRITDDTCFVGWDAHKQVVACDLDLVILTEPPYFRPGHLRAAVEAGKHVFMEKPVAVDPVGVRSVIESSRMADEKGLTIVAGTQSRRMVHLIEGMKRIHNGDIGQIVAGQCVRIGGGMLTWSEGTKERQPGWSDMEWHLRRWLFLTWLSGDFIVEMHVHNLDRINWALDGHPVQCVGLGGRQARTGPEYGNVFDHFAVEYEYPNGARIEYMGAQIDKATYRQANRVVGTKGQAYTDSGQFIIDGAKPFKYDGPQPSPVIKQHADQIEAIRTGKRLNEGVRIAESTMMCIMGRMSAYTGRALKWDWAMKASKLDLSPPREAFGDLPMRPVAVPGRTPLV